MSKTDKSSLKQYLLSKYATKEPKAFHQLDARMNMQGEAMAGDSDGDAICSLDTTELMDGTDVRVLIPATTSQKDAIRLLKKMIQWMELDDFTEQPPLLCSIPTAVTNSPADPFADETMERNAGEIKEVRLRVG